MNASATGVTVGGVAGAAAAAQLAEKQKTSAAHPDFYRFQQREHRRSGAQCRGMGWGC
jgi:gas vesicle protein